MTVQPALAQEIVVRTMQVIPFNVNVMDAHGIILGSGEASRIGQLHAGAQLALSQQRAIEIDAGTAKQLAGVRPGVNLPLTVRGQICGVVGLTGAPETVRQFGELVRITAEMILEQAQLTGELQQEKRYREEFVLQLLKPNKTNGEDLAAWALRLGVDLSQPRSAIVCTMGEPSPRLDKALRVIQQWQAALLVQRPDALVAAMSPRELVVLIKFDVETRRDALAEYAQQRLAHIAYMLSEGQSVLPQVALGVALSGAEGASLSYQSAQRTMRVGQQRDPKGRAYSFYDLSLPVLLAGLERGWQAEHLRRPLVRLAAVDRRGGVLRRTLVAWFAENAQVLATARTLHIHRNTLEYRLRRIGEITGLNLANAEDRMLLYVALQLE